MGSKVWPPLIVQVIAKQEFELLLQVTHDYDDLRADLTALIQSCPDVCPPLLEAGYLYASRYHMGCAMRFRSVTIPQGSTIDEAYLTFTAKSSLAGTCRYTRFHGEDADNPGDFDGETLTTLNVRWGNRTSASVDWDNVPAWTADTEYQGQEIKTVIKEIVDRVGWASGNALVLFWGDWDERSGNLPYRTRRPYAHNDESAKAVKLYVRYKV